MLVASTLRPCYNEMNMEQIFDKWHNKVQCPTGKSGASSIDYVNFLYVFIICWVGAALAFFWEICQLRCAPPRCYRTVRPHAPAPICYAMHMLGICYVTHASEPAGTDWDRMISVFKGTGLWQCITTEPLSCINKKTGQISLGRVRKALRVSFITAMQGDSAAYYKLMCCLRRYYVGSDLVAWQVRLALTLT